MRHAVQVKAEGKSTLSEAKGLLEVKNVKFEYPTKKDVLVLKGVSFETDIKHKRVVALCGTSGCGKSSLISLIERFYDPTEG
jgi:ABC-type multidrug transport system fused ATPase/permease subunit